MADEYAPPDGFNRVYSGGHHDVYCNGEEHIWTSGGGFTRCFPAVFRRRGKCNCQTWAADMFSGATVEVRHRG